MSPTSREYKPMAGIACAAAELTRLRERNAEVTKALADSVKDEFSMARRLRAGIVEARRHLAKGRALWNGPCIQCDAVLEATLRADAPTTDDYSAARITSLAATVKELREALDNATSRARMYDSDGVQIPVDNYNLKNGRRLLDASESVTEESEGEKDGE